MVRVLHRAQLSLQKDILSLLQRLPEIGGGVADIRREQLFVLRELLHDVLRLQLRLVIELCQKEILLHEEPLHLLPERVHIGQLADLDAGLRELVGEERSDAGAGRAEGLSGETRFLEGIKEHMVAHDDLRAVRDQKIRSRHALLRDLPDLLQDLTDVQRHSVPDHIDDAFGKCA